MVFFSILGTTMSFKFLELEEASMAYEIGDSKELVSMKMESAKLVSKFSSESKILFKDTNVSYVFKKGTKLSFHFRTYSTMTSAKFSIVKLNKTDEGWLAEGKNGTDKKFTSFPCTSKIYDIPKKIYKAVPNQELPVGTYALVFRNCVGNGFECSPENFGNSGVKIRIVD